jgi:Omp85 superfamily domain
MLIGGAYIFFSIPCTSQEQSQGKEPPDSSKTADQAQAEQSTTPAQPGTQPEKEAKPARRGAFVAVPIPIASPALGSGIIPAAAYIFRFSTKDKISSPSVIGGGGLITNNGSRALVVAGQLYVKENRYRITAAYARGNLNYDVYGSGIFEGHQLPLKQTGQVLFGEFLRQVGWKFYVGPRFTLGKSVLTLRPSDEQNVPIPPDLGFDTNLTALGFKVFRDTVPNRFYPTSGTSFKFTADFFAEGLGSKYSFQSYVATFNKYWSLDKKQVLAYNAYLCGTGGNPPFYGNCIYGASNELRGYTAGQYFTSYMAATQLEYRLALPWRFGLVGFGGVGGVIPGENQLYGSQEFLPGVGGGVRFLLSKQYHVNLRVDYGIGRNGHTVGMSIGEAF